VVDLARVAHVAGDGQRPAPLGAHRRGDGLERLGPPATDHDVRADPGELHGDRAADTLAGAGHDRDAIVKRIGREAHRRGYWMTECGVASRRVTLICSRSIMVGTLGEISFFQ